MPTRGPINIMCREEEAHGEVTQARLQLDTDNLSMGIGVTRSYDFATGLLSCIDAMDKSPRRPAFYPLAFASYC